MHACFSPANPSFSRAPRTHTRLRAGRRVLVYSTAAHSRAVNAPCLTPATGLRRRAMPVVHGTADVGVAAICRDVPQRQILREAHAPLLHTLRRGHVRVLPARLRGSRWCAAKSGFGSIPKHHEVSTFLEKSALPKLPSQVPGASTSQVLEHSMVFRHTDTLHPFWWHLGWTQSQTSWGPRSRRWAAFGGTRGASLGHAGAWDTPRRARWHSRSSPPRRRACCRSVGA